MSQIVCKNLSLGYEKRAVAEEINFTVNEGDYLCILGENGSGKSTLIKTLLCMGDRAVRVFEPQWFQTVLYKGRKGNRQRKYGAAGYQSSGKEVL